MFLHLGQYTVVKTDDIVGIFDIDNTTISKHTRKYLAHAEKKGIVINVSMELPRSFVVCKSNEKEAVYISQLSPVTLLKRFTSNNFDGGF
ncbi:MAG: DUF370 domain-containing protein [Ruminococcaceae bacterium]|nr:DUF370 domain-containing protein [Oscillospiraceae bacterium]